MMALALVGEKKCVRECFSCLCLALFFLKHSPCTADSQGALSTPLSEGSKRLEPLGEVIKDLLEKFGEGLFNKVPPACALHVKVRSHISLLVKNSNT